MSKPNQYIREEINEVIKTANKIIEKFSSRKEEENRDSGPIIIDSPERKRENDERKNHT